MQTHTAPGQHGVGHLSLGQLSTGSFGKVVQFEGDKKMARQMMGLGIAIGSELEMLQHRGKGVVVRSKGTRIAIGESIAKLLLVEPVQHN